MSELLDQDVRQRIIDFSDKYLAPYTIRTSGNDEKIIPELCPICHGGSHGKDKRTFALFTSNGMFVCKRGSCGRHGKFEELVKELSGEDVKLNRSVFSKKSDKQFVLPSIPVFDPTEEIYRYFESRKISRSTVDALRIGSDKEGNIVFRFFWNGEDVYHKFRKPRKPLPEDKGRKEWQESGTKAILYNMDNVVFNKPLIITEGECFNGNAEIMTPDGWIRLEDYAGQDVLQVDQNMNGSFVKPLAYINKYYSGDMVDISIGGNYFSSTTRDHNLVAIQRDNGSVRKFKASEHIPDSYNIPTAINFESSGLDLTDAEIALLLAISADGTIDVRKGSGYKIPKEKYYVRFGLQKQRKVDRLCMWLDKAGIQYSNNPIFQNGKEYRSICFSCPDSIAHKYLPWDLVTKTSLRQKKFIIEELVHWDGNTVPNRKQYEYCSVIKHNAEVIQAVSHTCGYMSTIIHRIIGGNENFCTQHMYKVSILLNKHYVSAQRIDDNRSYRNVSQSVYCVTVPTGMILIRQNECISVSGNCDAMALYEAGLTNVVSVPCGVDNNDWITYCYDWLEKFHTILIFGDNDAAGRRGVENWTKKLGDYRCLVVRDYPQIPGTNPPQYCKDANEILYRFGESVLLEMVESADEIETRGLLRLADVVPVDPTTIPRIKTMIPALDDALGGLVEGGITVLTGPPGTGKSTFASQLLLSAVEQGYTVCAYSGELNKENFQTWCNLQAAGSEYIGLKWDPIRNKMVPFVPLDIQNRIMQWYGPKFYLYNNEEVFVDVKQADAIVNVFTMCARKHGAKLFLCDNLLTTTADSDDEWRAQAVFVNSMKKFAVHYQAHVIIVAHPRKQKQGEIIDRSSVSGSSAIVNLADNAIVVQRPDLRIIKNRTTGVQREVACAFCGDSRRIYQADVGDKFQFSWDRTGLKHPDPRADSMPEYDIQLSQLDRQPF